MTRREMLGTLAGSLALLRAAPALFAATGEAQNPLGVCTNSFDVHWKAAREKHPQADFSDAIGFVEHCHRLGAAGVQIGLSSKEPAFVAKFRDALESHQMYYEGSVGLPRQDSDVERFETEVRTAKDAGAEVIRTAMLSGRRYETFDSAAAFLEFSRASWLSLTRAEPVLRKLRMRAAVENHKDRLVPELLEMLKRISSEFVGVCVDTGNNIALSEQPLEVVEALAPFAFSTHLKDMAVQEYEDGFLLSEAPLGEGFLDLPQMVKVLRQANPRLHFCLEMITRDPLKVPCLTPKYWATMENRPASHLASAMTLVRRSASKQPLPRPSGLDLTAQLALEEDNVKKSFAYAQQHLRG
jgi:sugar phosphate isomerase/epimerase